MTRKSSAIKDSFFRGDYQSALAKSIDHPGREWRLQDLGYIVGALCFVGRSVEGETLFLVHAASLSLEQKIKVRYFLGVGFTRVSNYQKARHYFALNRRALGSKVSLESRFFVFQGIGFYRYFCCKWRFALRDSKLAFDAALRAQFLYGRVVSADLHGHLLVQTGEVHHGLRVLKEAQALALQIGNTGVAGAIEISRVGYDAQFGLSGSRTVPKLQKYLKSTASVQDTYSHAALLLEMARQMILRGDFEAAGQALDQAARMIYARQNRRQECTLNLRYAYLAYLRDEVPLGLSFLQSAKRALDLSIDHALRLAALGLELKLVERLGMPERQKQVEAEIDTESAMYGGWINQNIRARYAGDIRLSHAAAVDPLGSLRDQISMDFETALEAVLKTEYHGFLLEVFPQFRGRSVLYFGLDETSAILFSSRKVSYLKGLTPFQRAILRNLASGPKSKAELIGSVWRYPVYHPLQHDPVIYQAVTGLRKFLDEFASWIETTENGYRLRNGVTIEQMAHSSSTETGLATSTPSDGIHKSSLNHRQVKFMFAGRIGEFISVHGYKERFGVSEITASRDLSNLFRLGIVIRIGRARSTRYSIKEKFTWSKSASIPR
jgi:DNA-binding winged helix-turn-helix (wHTH) protein